MTNTLSIFQCFTSLKRVSSTHGGEYHGSCPLCGGNDRFMCWPSRSRADGPTWWCRQCRQCGDVVKLSMLANAYDFPSACAALGIEPTEWGTQQFDNCEDNTITSPQPPPPDWQNTYANQLKEWQALLWSPAGAGARTWLEQRGINEGGMRNFQLGYHPGDNNLPKGIVIPTIQDGHLWAIKIRKARAIGGKYHVITGSTLILFDWRASCAPVLLVESELDAMLLWQEHLLDALATGSAGNMHPYTHVQLATRPYVLLGFDNDEAGTQACKKWEQVLPRAMRHRPIGHDWTEMYQNGENIKDWLIMGMTWRPAETATQSPTTTPPPDIEPLDYVQAIAAHLEQQTRRYWYTTTPDGKEHYRSELSDNQVISRYSKRHSYPHVRLSNGVEIPRTGWKGLGFHRPEVHQQLAQDIRDNATRRLP